MASVFLAIALGTLGFLASWFTCYDNSRRGLRKITPVGWLMLVLLILTTGITANVSKIESDRANREVSAVRAELAAAQNVLDESQAALRKTSDALEHLSKSYREAEGIEAWHASAKLQVETLRPLMQMMETSSQWPDESMRRAMQKGHVDGVLGKATVEMFPGYWKNLIAVLPVNSMGHRTAITDQNRLQQKADHYSTMSEMPPEVRLHYLLAFLRDVHASSEDCIRKTHLELLITSAMRRSGETDEAIGSFIGGLRKRVSNASQSTDEVESNE